jgi:glycosyltransferase involved in cell wall biosynthesis
MNEQGLPLISIVIPVYNGANYMRAAIDSALAQTYPRIEVLVVNDGSRDDGATERIARAYGERVRYFAKENGGVASALNLGLREMRGSYFAWLSHDDVFLPEKTSLQVDFLRKNEAFAACYSDYFRIDSQGKVLREVRTPWLPRQKALPALFARQYINGSTVMARRECFDRVGSFNEALRYTQDMEMWFRLLQYFEIGRVPRPLAGWRVHPEQGSRESRPHQKEAQEVLERLFLELSNTGLLDQWGKTATGPERLARMHIRFGRSVSHGRGWYAMGGEHLRQALSLWPSPGNPARFLLLLNRLTPLHHRAQRWRVRAVHGLMTRLRSRAGKK